MPDTGTDIPKLSTGQPSTLGTYLDNCDALFGPGNAASKYFASKIASSPRGRNDVVIAPESQVMALIGSMICGPQKEPAP